MSHSPIRRTAGPFFADQLKPGDPYELSQGHPVECLPGGGRHAKANLSGGLVLETDPEVEAAGVDAGYSAGPHMLRAPDIAVGNVPDTPGWVQGVPLLAVEYADVGQDEEELQTKIGELLSAGTRVVWVVRLVGPRRVEVYEPSVACRIVLPGEQLQVPGILRNLVPVEALYDRRAAHETALRNLLQRQGYQDLNAVRDESKEEGKTEGEIAIIVRQLRRRLGDLSPQHEARLRALSVEQLEALSEALLDFRAAADLSAWLGGL